MSRKITPKCLGLAIMLLLGGLHIPVFADTATTPPKKFTILHTNDHHGRFWHNTDGELGMAARYTLINRIRKEVEAAGGSVLLLSGGDINTGVPESDMQDAEPDFVGMKALKYDAMALGNHEFDNPLPVLRHQQEIAGFPFLSANIYAKDSGKRLFQPWQLFERSGLKIAVIGLTTEDTAKIGNPEYLDNVEFRDPKLEAKNLIAELEQQEKPDLMIAATHMGHYDKGQHGYNAPGDVTLARSLPAGALDVIIGGHSQEALCVTPEHVRNKDYQPGAACVPDQQNGTWIMQAHEWGKYVGRADFEYAEGKLKLVHYALIPINLKKKVKVGEETKKVFITEEIPQDKAIMALLGPYQQKGMEKINIKIGSVNKELVGERDKVRFQQTNLGRLIATAQREKSKADFGIMNSGGVRTSINEGNITYKEVLEVHPFGNTIAYVDMKGSELPAYLAQVATKPVDTGAYAQFANISMTVYPDRVEDIKIAGVPLDPNKTYRFSLPSFAAAGGDGYPKVNTQPGYVDTGFVDADVLREYIEQHSPLDANAFNPGEAIVYRK
ncbi:bifunctional UDP-sugar hydrolase/5'-nucleotidase UshA [Thiofilum flexile]|uniref:bifunctional UDP-sugar hydrolase/5'-nucleotidase UshA n=1 Tax=Thiofilum flexile TaxID=125627 RepID=UPI000374B5E8|nr:bifunctional UDP-sugar hydrolase/5'-nucleotidase UshA [Thiofilum flexile]